jgi:hypothetical protein
VNSLGIKAKSMNLVNLLVWVEINGPAPLAAMKCCFGCFGKNYFSWGRVFGAFEIADRLGQGIVSEERPALDSIIACELPLISSGCTEVDLIASSRELEGSNYADSITAAQPSTRVGKLMNPMSTVTFTPSH